MGDYSRNDSWAHMVETPGGNGANVHASRAFFTMAADLTGDPKLKKVAEWMLRRELQEINVSGDFVECLQPTIDPIATSVSKVTSSLFVFIFVL